MNLNLRDRWRWLRAEFRWRILGRRYKVVFSPQAEQQLAELPPEIREEIMRTVEEMQRNPWAHAEKMPTRPCPRCGDPMIPSGDGWYCPECDLEVEE